MKPEDFDYHPLPAVRAWNPEVPVSGSSSATHAFGFQPSTSSFNTAHQHQERDRLGDVPAGGGGEGKPVLIDLDGNGVQIAQIDETFHLFDTGDSGLTHRMAWADAGDGVLFIDADGDGTISDEREFIFTEWDPTAGGDMEALRSVFDTDGDGKLDADDAAFADFRIMVTLADGSTQAMTLAQLGITEIDLTPDETFIELPDGSMITGQTTFTRADGTTGTAANTVLARDPNGYSLERAAEQSMSCDIMTMSWLCAGAWRGPDGARS